MRLPVLLLAAALLPAGALVAGAVGPACVPQSVHLYVTSGAFDVDALTMDFGVGSVSVADTNAGDCNGDGQGDDFDGDYDLGFGGAAFGWGPWATDPLCGYGLNVHGPFVTVTDVVVQDLLVVVGEDDQDGPMVVVDDVTGETFCETDGMIAPETDADDCLVQHVNRGRTCGTGGGDGLFWVFLTTLVRDGPVGVTATGPTAGTVTATWTL